MLDHKDANGRCKDFDKIFINVCQEIGVGKWKLIANQLRSIYNFNVDDKYLLQRWRLINPELTKAAFTLQQQCEFWDVCLAAKFDWPLICKKYQERCINKRKDTFIRSFINMFERALLHLVRLLIRKKQFMSVKIQSMYPYTFRLIVNFCYEKNCENVESIRDSCRVLLTICNLLIRNQQLKRADLYELVSKNITKQSVMAALEDCFKINYYYKIGSNLLGSVPCHMRKRDNYIDPIELSVSKLEIFEIQKTPLYRKLFQDRVFNHNFIEMYNSAKVNIIEDMNLNMQMIKRQPYSMKPVKVQQDKLKITTVRGRIRNNQERFPNHLTVKFDHQQEEEEEQLQRLLQGMPDVVII